MHYYRCTYYILVVGRYKAVFLRKSSVDMPLYQVKREHLELQDKLGEGAFGMVFKGSLLTKPKYDSSIVVAVKELSSKLTIFIGAITLLW